MPALVLAVLHKRMDLMALSVAWIDKAGCDIGVGVASEIAPEPRGGLCSRSSKLK